MEFRHQGRRAIKAVSLSWECDFTNSFHPLLKLSAPYETITCLHLEMTAVIQGM
jgi:hypothetical protein